MTPKNAESGGGGGAAAAAPPSPAAAATSSTAGDAGKSPALRGSHKKIIYFVRHAEATHNVREREAVQAVIASGVTAKSEQEKARKAVLREGGDELRDAPLSGGGLAQVQRSSERLAEFTRRQSEGGAPPEIVLVSPLRRALMTATELFLDGGGDGGGKSPKFLAIEALREKRTGLACDERSSVETLRAEFPHVNFDDVEAAENGTLPNFKIPDTGEDNPKVRARVKAFLENRLPHFDSTHLAVVSHKGWLRELRHTLRSYLDSGAIHADFDLDSWHNVLFGNAEVRIAALRWHDGELASVVSRTVDNAVSMLDDGFRHALNIGPPESGFSMFLAERTKKVHFIVNGEGRHNVATRRIGSNDCLLRDEGQQASDHPLYDARLTPRGIKQARALRAVLANRPSGFRPYTAFELVVVSPLTRALETAWHVFGPEEDKDGNAQVGSAPSGSPERNEKAGVLSVPPPPRFLVREECRERYGRHVCDGRRPVSALMDEFPSFDFEDVADYDEDPLYGDEVEPPARCRDRAAHFLEWLSTRPERCVAVVTHASFLRHLLGQFGDNLGEEDRDRLQRSACDCELRSVVLCSHDRRVVRMAADSDDDDDDGDDDGRLLGRERQVPIVLSSSGAAAAGAAPSTYRVPSLTSLSGLADGPQQA